MSAIPKSPSESDQVVYRGRTFAGAVSLRAGRWLAFDVDGRKIGRFENRLEAVAAILRKDGAT
jgi:hypothetical protein